MRNGLISLLTVVVVTSLATAAVLAISTSHAMQALASRQAEMTLEGYAAERSGQALVASVDDVLYQAREDGLEASKAISRLKKQINNILVNACVDTVTATFEFNGNKLDVTFITSSGRSLEVCLAVTNEVSYRIESWKLTAAQVEEDTGDVLWTPSTAGD
jgi:hypothetical protein